MYELDCNVSKEYTVVVDELHKVICKDILTHKRKRRLSRTELESIKDVIKCFLKNCKRCSGDVLSITLDKTHYSSPYFINGRPSGKRISYEFTRDLITYLYNEGLIDMTIGYANTEYHHTLKKMVVVESMPTLIRLLPRFKMMVDSIDTSLTDKLRRSVMFMRDANGKFKSFRLDTEDSEVRDFLNKYNYFSLGKVVECDGNVYDVQSYKIYSLNKLFGGRSYMSGSIQSLSSEDRSKITIDGLRTVRYDYKGFEPSLAYSTKNLILKGDPYSVVGYDEYDADLLRDIVKHSMLVMLNADSQESASHAINKWVKDNYNIADLYAKGMIPRKTLPIKSIMNSIAKRHEDINDMFYKSSWKVVQKLGADIIDRVVETMMQYYGSLCLQVFDECIVQEEFEERLVFTMSEAYEDITGMPENCNVVKEE